ncbi:MAG: HAD family phosphatase [Thermodesulfobacteriota bacterium]|nr:HAD family phosphatase [Thermodesulfobacteriota bacterium]
MKKFFIPPVGSPFKSEEMEKNQHYKLTIFDLDGTLTQERSIWEYIHARLGKWYGFAEEYQNQFLAGKISYEEFCERDAEVWKGMKLEELSGIVEAVPFHPGAGELIRYLKGKGLKLSMVSSGLSLLTDWVHQKFGFDYSVSNDLLHENGVLSGKVRIQVHYDKKAEWVRRILQEFDFKPEEAIAVGDSKGDMDMFQMVGFSVAFNSSCSELDRIASVCVPSQNLADIIPKLPL